MLHSYCCISLVFATTVFAEYDIRNMSKPVRIMSLIKFFLTVLSMNVIFNRVTAQDKKQLRKLENKGKAFMRPETAVPFNEI